MACAIESYGLFEVFTQLVEKEKDAVFFIIVFLRIFVENGHEVEIEMLFGLRGWFCIRVAHKDIARYSEIVRFPVDGMLPDFEIGAVHLPVNRHDLCQKIIEIVIFDGIGHCGRIIDDILFIIHTTFNAQMVFQVFFIALKILTYSSFNNIA